MGQWWWESVCSRDLSCDLIQGVDNQAKVCSPWVAAPLSRLCEFQSQHCSFMIGKLNYNTGLRSMCTYLSIVALTTTLFPLLWTPKCIQS